MTAVSLPLAMSELIGDAPSGQAQRKLSLFPKQTGRQRLSLSFLDGGEEYSKDVLDGLLANGYYPDGVADAGYYLIPLGESETASRDCDKEADVGLMPVRLVRLLEEEFVQLQDVREGWLYVFVDGCLWREIRINKDSVFQDINLAKHQGKDSRPCGGMAFEYGMVSLPYRMEGKSPELQVAFSEVQWTWSYICKMGGMAQDDLRYLPELEIHNAYRDIQPDEAFRNSRFQTLDLAAYSGGWNIQKMKTHFLCPANAVEEHRESEEGKELSPLSPEDISGRVAYLAVKDPLASAREMADEYSSLLELEAALEAQADSSGEFPLALLVRELVKEDEKHSDGQGLREHVRMDKVESTIEAWEELTKKLVAKREQADADLALKLQQPQVRSALADYFQSGNDYCHALGVIHWTLLTGECRTTQMAGYRQRVLRGEEEWLESLKKLPFPVVEQLRAITALDNEVYRAAREDLSSSLGPEGGVSITAAITGVIAQLIEGYAHLHTDKLVNLASDALNKVADDVVHLAGVAVQALQMPLARAVLLEQINPLKPGEYRYEPKGFSQSIKAIGESRVFQILPEGKSVSAYLESLSGNSTFQRYAIRVLAPLHIINASLAIKDLTESQGAETKLPAFSGIMSALSFFGGEAEKWGKKSLEALGEKDAEARKLIRKSEKILERPNRHSSRSRARASRRLKANQLLRSGYKTKKMPLTITESAGLVAKKAFGAAGGLAEVVFGGWNVTKGVATGNAQVAAGGGLGVVGGALITWGVLTSSSVVAAPLGVVLALAGGVAVMMGERSKLEDALRLGYFGQDAYPVIGGPFDESIDPVRLGPESGLLNETRLLPDLSEEINYFRRLFCHVQAKIGIHRESRPSFQSMGGTTIPASDHVIIKARVDISGYQSGQSKLKMTVRLFHEPGWVPGKSGWSYPVQSMYTKAILDGDSLVAVEGFLRLPREEVSNGFGRAEIEASVDLMGDGGLLSPVDGPATHWSWQWEDRSISDHEWRSIEKTATPPTMTPREIS